MASRRIAFLTLSVVGLVVAVLLLVVLAQAQDSPSLPAVPGVAIAPPAGRSAAHPSGAPSEPRFPAAFQAGPAAQKSSARSSPSQAQPASGPYRSPGPARTAPDRITDIAARLPAGDRAYRSSWLPGRAAALSATPVITFQVIYGQVTGYTDAESDVHLLLWRGGLPAGEARMRSDAVGYFYAELMHDGRWTTAQPGDALDVVVNGVTTTLDVPVLTGLVDAAADTAAGTIGGVPLPADLRVSAWGNWLAVTSDGAGNYLADLSSLTDITWIDGVTVGFQDGNDNWLAFSFAPQNGMLVRLDGSRVVGYTQPEAVVTVTLDHSGDLTTNTAVADFRDGFWGVEFDTIGAGDVVTAELGGAIVVDTVSGLAAGFDLVNDQVTGTGPTNSEVSVFSLQPERLRWWCPTRRVPTDGDGLFVADFSADGLDTWTPACVVHHDTTQADTLIYTQPPLAQVEWPGNNIWGHAQPEVVITATLYDGGGPTEQVTATTGPDYGDYWAAFQTPFQPGQQMTVQGGGLDVTIDLDTVTANLDVDAETLYGQAPPSTTLWASTGSYFGPYFQDYTTADGSGAYQVNLSAVKDVHNEAWVNAQVPQDNDVDQPGWLMDSGVSPYLDLNETENGVWGRVPQEGALVTLTLKTGGGAIKGITEAQSDSYGDFGWQQFTDEYGGVIDIEPGDQVEFQVGGWSQTSFAPGIAVSVDADTDRVTGTGPAESFVEVYVHDYWPPLHVPTGADGSFLADFAGMVDIQPGTRVDVGHHDENWNRRLVVGTAPHVWFRANTFGDWVDGSTSPDATVWITATDNLGALKGTSTTTARPDGWFDGVDLWLGGQRTDLLPGDVIHVASSDGTQATGTLIAIEGELSVAGDYAAGQMSDGVFPASGHVDLWQRSTGQWFGWDLTIEADGSFNLDLSDQVDVQAGDNAEVWYYDAAGNWLGTLFVTPYLQANIQRTDNWVNGEASPFVTVTVVISDSTGAFKGGGQSWTGGGTWFHVNPQWPDGSGTDIETGDTVIVSAPGVSATLPVIGLEAAVVAAGDVISGHVPGAVSYPADLDVEIWDIPAGYGGRFQTDGSGGFSVDLTGSYDVRLGEQVAVWYVRPDGHRVGIVRSELRVYPNVTDDWVGEATAPHTLVEVTVSDGGPLDAVKGTASGWSDDEGYFGLEPRLNDERTDILPGDVVEATANGYSASLTIPVPFSATYDHLANIISGQAPASSTLQVWIDGYPGLWLTVPVSGEWSVDFGPYGDPQIWDQGHVNYYDEQGHVARLECRVPTPDLRLEKWVEGNNQAAPSGRSVFTLRYVNDGSVDAATIILTDTLPADTAYITDTSGVPPDIGPGWVAWTLPGLAPGEEAQFQLVLANSAEPDATLRNQADVWAEDDYNTGNNHAEAEVYVIDEQPDLYANKNPAPGDPAPGQTFLWEINYGNNRPVPAGPVILTDTFPAGTNLVSWYSENGYNLWQEVETGDRLVLAAPAIPGYWSDRIILQLLVGSGLPVGTQLLNRIDISAPDDANPDDNWQEREAWVSPPRWDAGIYKSFNWGQLVPGGEAAYSIHLRNHGNTAAAVTFTDTLPAGTHFAEAWAWVGPDYVPFPPDYVDDEIAVWEDITLEPGVWINLDLHLTLDEGTLPGADLTNCIAIAMDGDSDPFNDTSCVTDAVREPGPNLRLVKSVWWNGQGQLEYEIRLENIGSENLDDFEITDIYPEDTAWNDDWWVKWGPSMTVTHDAPNRRLDFWVDDLGPGGTAGIGFRVDLDGGFIGEQGLAFTNTAQAPITGDVYPADNEASATAYTGPDLFAEKWISAGRARPAEVLTFTVRTGNANRWPWEMSESTSLILTERLPDGMTLVAAVWPDGNPLDPFFEDPDNGVFMFDFGRMGSEDWRWFYLVVRLGDDLWGDVLLNRLEAWEWPAVDIDPIPGNNTFEYAVTVEGGRIYLPMVLVNW